MTVRILLGGSFDPPHLGHLALLNFVAHSYNTENKVLIPNARNPLKEAVSTPFHHRLAMTQLLVGESAEVIDWEADETVAHYTIDLIRRARRHWQEQLVFVVGADVLDTLHLWKEVKELFSLVTMQLVTRPGFRLDVTDELKVTVGQPVDDFIKNRLAMTPVPLSSSDLRESLRETGKVEGLPEPVLSYIRRHQLYH